MKCVVCGGKLKERRVDLPFSYKDHLVLIKSIRAHVCEQCGESYLSPKSDGLLKSLFDKIDDNKASFRKLRAIVEVAP